MQRRNIPFEAQKAFNVIYKGVLVAEGKMDLLIAGRLVVEIKAVEQLAPVHRLQVLTYMRNVNQPLGLLLNFYVSTLKQGIRRIVHSM